MNSFIQGKRGLSNWQKKGDNIKTPKRKLEEDLPQTLENNYFSYKIAEEEVGDLMEESILIRQREIEKKKQDLFSSYQDKLKRKPIKDYGTVVLQDNEYKVKKLTTTRDLFYAGMDWGNCLSSNTYLFFRCYSINLGKEGDDIINWDTVESRRWTNETDYYAIYIKHKNKTKYRKHAILDTYTTFKEETIKDIKEIKGPNNKEINQEDTYHIFNLLKRIEK